MPISLRVPALLLKQIRVVAAARDLPYQALIKLWLEEALVRQTPVASRPITLRLTAEQLTCLQESGSLDIHLETA